MWDRSFVLRWNLTNHLQASFRSGTQARIEEPHMQVNKKLNPDQYQVWKDSVRQSLLHLGQPLAYDQDFQATYYFPFVFFKPLDWLQGSLHYQARYNWHRTTAIHDSLWVGNTIQNQSVVKYQGSLNFLSLYNKHKTLRKINSESFKFHLLQILMSIKRSQLSFERINGMTLPGFRPETGDMFGQKKFAGELAPGWKFAFGGVSISYIEKAMDKNWLIRKESYTDPALIHYTGKLSYQTLIEPIPGLKIELTADRVNSHTTQVQYMYAGMPCFRGGVVLPCRLLQCIKILTVFFLTGIL
ncbi:MAG: hypothetical protein LIP01_06055 [Tannerellaceae bacterium]|nr:hypothetical protein [Tannerellaceae bacterium]